MKRLICWLVVIGSVYAVPVYGGVIQLPATEQTGCYDNLGNLLSCEGTGMDAEFRMGVPWPSPRFVDNENGTISDYLTGLIWTKNGGSPDYSSCTGGPKTWLEALQYAKCLNEHGYLGFADWRVPNINELSSLMQFPETNWVSHRLMGYGFENMSTFYWSSTTDTVTGSSAYHANFGFGGIMTYGKRFRDLSVILVRSPSDLGREPLVALPATGQTTCYNDGLPDIPCEGTGQDGEYREGAAWPAQRFTSQGDGTVKDNLTGLYWARDAGTPEFGNCPGGRKDWLGGLNYVSCLNQNNYLGHTDWRMPNFNELSSLANRGTTDSGVQWFASVGFTNFTADWYWTSTYTPAFVKEPLVNAQAGSLLGTFTPYGDKDGNAIYVWPVRGDSSLPANRPPFLQPIGDKTAYESQTLQFTISASDADGDRLAYSVSNLPTGATFDSATAIFTWKPDFDQAAAYPNVHFTVTDNGTPPMSSSEAITITVGNVNRPPAIEPIGPKSTLENHRLQFTIEAADPDGDAVTFTSSNLPPDASFDPISGTFDWLPGYDQAGSYTNVRFTATDNGLPSQSASEAITITINNVNRPPVLDAIGNKTTIEGQTLSFTVTATDPDADVLNYSASNLPEGAVFNGITQTFSWAPTYLQAGVYQDILLAVTDGGFPSAVDTEFITIAVNNVNRPPVFDPVGTQQVLEENTLRFSVRAIDYDGDNISYYVGTLPLGATFDPTTRQLLWTPGFNQVGNHTVTFYAQDDGTPMETGSIGVVIVVGAIPTPCDLTNALLSTAMKAGASKDTLNSYSANLKKVCNFVEDGRLIPAKNQVNAFVQKVNTDMGQGKIDQTTGNNLLAGANQLLSELGEQ
jgi:hypothetical protein